MLMFVFVVVRRTAAFLCALFFTSRICIYHLGPHKFDQVRLQSITTHMHSLQEGNVFSPVRLSVCDRYP